MTAPSDGDIEAYSAGSLTPPSIICTMTDDNQSTDRIYKFFSTAGKVKTGSDPNTEPSEYWDAHLNYERDTGTDGVADGDKAGTIFTGSISFSWTGASVGTQWISGLMKDAWVGRDDSIVEDTFKNNVTVQGACGGKQAVNIDTNGDGTDNIVISPVKIHVVGAIACIFDGTDIFRVGSGSVSVGATTFHVGGQCRPEGTWADGDSKVWGTDNDDELVYILESSDTGDFTGEEDTEFDSSSVNIVYKVGAETDGSGTELDPPFTTRAVTKEITLASGTTKYYRLTVIYDTTSRTITFDVTTP